MKKTGVIFLILFIIIVVSTLVFPVLFKDKLREAAQNTLNSKLNAKVEFSDFKLSVLKSFPKISLTMNRVLVTGLNEYKNDTLLFVPEMNSRVALFSVFNKSGLVINDLLLQNALLNLVSTEKSANWDIAIESGSQDNLSDQFSSEEEKTAESFQIQLEKISIKNAIFRYRDLAAEMEILSDNINLDVNGNLYGTNANLIIAGVLGNFNISYGGINYLSKVKVKTQSVVAVDYEAMNFSFQEGEFVLNNLPLLVTGSFNIPSDSMHFDLKLNSKTTEFDNILALFPGDYQKYISDFETSGKTNIVGQINGSYIDEEYPAFLLKIDIEGGRLKHKELSGEISDINAKLAIDKKQGNLNLTEISINEARMQVKNNPFDFMFRMNNLMEDPFFDGTFVGKVNFNDLKDVLPLDSVNVLGLVDANFFVKANYSSIENENYEALSTSGMVLLRNFIFNSPNLTQQIEVKQGQLQLSAKSVQLNDFSAKIGNSDFNLSGEIKNYLSYYFNNAELNGNLRLSSRFVNLNELLLLQVRETESSNAAIRQSKEEQEIESDTISAEKQIKAIQIPHNINITFSSNISNAVFDRINISNIRGLISAKNGKLVLEGLSMNMLDGSMNLSGMYASSTQNQPKFDFKFNISDFDIPAAYQSLSGFRRVLPGAQQSTGKLNSGFQLSGVFSEDLQVFPTTLNGNGYLKSENLEIKNSPVFQQLDGILRAEKLKDIKVDDFTANFNIADGNLFLKPFKTKIAGQETQINGMLNSQNIIDMRLDFQVERDAFGTDIQSILNAIPGNKKLTKLPAAVIINGPAGKPEVNVDLSETKKAITNAAKDDLQNSLDKIGKGLLKLFEK